MKFFMFFFLFFYSFSSSALVCRGNEPFWNAQVFKKGITFKRLGSSSIFFKFNNIKAAEGMPMSFLKTFRYNLTPLATIKEGVCVDSMSGETFQKQGIFYLTGKVFYGCCE